MRFAGTLLAVSLALGSAPVAAQTAAPTAQEPKPGPAPAAAQSAPAQETPPQDRAPVKPDNKPADAADTPSPSAADKPPPGKEPTADEICRTVEEAAAENGLPVEFFARVIWQESRFNARAVSAKGAQGIAQFMPQTADVRGLADPFDPIASLHKAGGYLRDLRQRFGNLGLAAAGYNAGPGRVSAWLGHQRGLPEETRNYVATITGWTADEWASPSPPKEPQTTIPQGVPCTQLAHLLLAPPKEAQRLAAYVPAWGAQLTANLSESQAWAIYRTLQRRYAKVIGDREPIVLHARVPGMGNAARYMIRVADDNKGYLNGFCNKLIAAGGACVVLRNRR